MVAEVYRMREPCRWCQRDRGELHMEGKIVTSGGQDVVRCLACGRACYNAPKSETGKPVRHVKSRPDLKEGQRERIILQMGARCFLCGRDPLTHGVVLHIAHALSVNENGKLEHPLNEDQLFDDSNLFPACEECNLGMRTVSLEPAIMVRLILAKMKRRSPNGD